MTFMSFFSNNNVLPSWFSFPAAALYLQAALQPTGRVCFLLLSNTVPLSEVQGMRAE